ncbi:MAG: lipoate protein ligase C-terminal domain-containing protein [Candidatus Norongarragalinales archaeon]
MPFILSFAEKGVFSLDGKYSASEKVEGGKLVSIEVSVEKGLIAKAKITGDFFLHPEESITALENALVGVKVPFDWIDAEKKLLTVITDNQLNLVGVKSGNVISVLHKAVSQKQST